MAIRLQSKDNVTAPGGDYPYGNIKDDDGTGNGTPVTKAVYADFHQFFGRLLALGGVVGNDLPENSANTFQYHTALQNIINTSVIGFLQLKGGIDCSANPNYPAASKGWSYVVTVAGKIGGASGIVVAVGDYIIASADNAGGTQGAVGASWFIVERNLDLATETSPGIAELATTAETQTGTDDARIVTPLKLRTQQGWQNITLINGWASAGTDTVQYRIDNFGQVQLRGSLDPAGASSSIFATLPVGVRPLRDTFLSSYDPSGSYFIRINTTGSMIAANPSSNSLAGLAFWTD